jgi:hypothetical protein
MRGMHGHDSQSVPYPSLWFFSTQFLTNNKCPVIPCIAPLPFRAEWSRTVRGAYKRSRSFRHARAVPTWSFEKRRIPLLSNFPSFFSLGNGRTKHFFVVRPHPPKCQVGRDIKRHKRAYSHRIHGSHQIRVRLLCQLGCFHKPPSSPRHLRHPSVDTVRNKVEPDRLW